jgi:hypothetical protein
VLAFFEGTLNAHNHHNNRLNAYKVRGKKSVKQSKQYLYRVADLVLAVGEVFVDADDVALADDIERVAFDGRVYRGALLCGGFLGGALGGGGREEAVSKAKGNGRLGRPETEREVVLLVVATACQTRSSGHPAPPCRSGNHTERRRKEATPHWQTPM